MYLDLKKIKTVTKTYFENIKITVCLPFLMSQITGFFLVENVIENVINIISKLVIDLTILILVLACLF